MASRIAIRTSSMALQRSLNLSASRRCISTSLRTDCALRTRKPNRLSHAALQESFRRAYSDAPSVSLSPPPKPKKRFGFLRWTWRVTYLSAIGFVGWLTYTVWELRNPNDQFEPDPSKKTLVILGESGIYQAFACILLNIDRDGLGRGVVTQETRHGELQCCGNLATKLLPLHPTSALVYDWNNRTSVHHGAYP